MAKKKKSDFEKSVEKVEKETGMAIHFGSDDKQTNTSIEVIPTPSLTLNYELGCGGIPRGRIIEFFGPESGGKSTLAQLMIGTEQEKGNNTLYIDAENGFEPNYAEQLGVDTSSETWAYTQPDYAEQMFTSIERYLEEKLFSLIVVDSVTALLPKAEFDTEIEDQHYAPLAKVLSKAMRRLAKKIAVSNTTVIFINQLREEIGKVFGNPEKTPGGRALKFYSSVRLRINILSDGYQKDDEGKVIGHKIKTKIVKNKVGPPLGEPSFILYYGDGVGQAYEIFEMGKNKDVIFKSGHTYYYKTKDWDPEKDEEKKSNDNVEKIAVGEDATIEELKGNEEKFEAIRKRVLN